MQLQYANDRKRAAPICKCYHGKGQLQYINVIMDKNFVEMGGTSAQCQSHCSVKRRSRLPSPNLCLKNTPRTITMQGLTVPPFTAVQKCSFVDC